MGDIGNVLLWSMLGALAAFKWIWKPNSEKQIQVMADLVKKKDEELETCKNDLALMTKQINEEHEQLRKKREEELEALRSEDELHQIANDHLQFMEVLLEERQKVFCSYLVHRGQRYKIEKDLTCIVDQDPVLAKLGLNTELNDIFNNDMHCADLLNKDTQKNGKLMWIYLELWKERVTLQKYKKAHEILRGLLNSK